LVDDDEASSVSSEHSDYVAEDSQDSEEEEIEEGGSDSDAPVTSVRKRAVQGTRNSKRGASKTPAKGPTEKPGMANTTTLKKKAGKLQANKAAQQSAPVCRQSPTKSSVIKF
jgi:hypothetical protein